jgi:CubicO group peptidase (beta-lactamase class C family)
MPDAIQQMLQKFVDAGELAGAATGVWRDGKATIRCAGVRDLATGQPVEADTIFRIASMSKPVTAVAALTLVDEGRIGLDEPIAQRWAPEFAEMRVLRDPNGPLDDTVPAERPITFRHLLTHTAGLTYADFQSGPINEAYKAALGPDIDSPVRPEAWIAGLARLPLIDQPGGTFHYSRCSDLLGLLVARIAGRPLEAVLRERIFAPLGMADTGFRVPEAKQERQAAHTGFDAAGKLVRRDAVPGGAALPERPADMAYVSGGQGLWSTLQDYLAFAKSFVGAGPALLKPETLEAMMSNQLTPEQRQSARMFGMPLFAQGHGFGLGVAVVMEPEHAQVVRCGGGLGSVGWPGAYGGWWQADPGAGTALVFLTHNMLELEQLMAGVGLGVYAAITEFEGVAKAG